MAEVIESLEEFLKSNDDIDIQDLECADSWRILTDPLETVDEDSLFLSTAFEVGKKRILADDEVSQLTEEQNLTKIARFDSESNKTQRLSLVEEFIESFNLADTDRLRTLLDNHCSETMTLQVPRIGLAISGRNFLYAYWFIVHETFPDGVMKVLEKRHVSTAQPRNKQLKKGALPQVECVYKFSGTKITSDEATSILKDFADAFPDFARYSYDQLSEKMSDFIATRTPPTENELQRSTVVELVLTFEAIEENNFFSSTSDSYLNIESKLTVKDWAFNLLASSDDFNPSSA